MSTTATAVGLKQASSYTLKNLWTGTTSQTPGTIRAFLGAHASAMFRVSTSMCSVSP